MSSIIGAKADQRNGPTKPKISNTPQSEKHPQMPPTNGINEPVRLPRMPWTAAWPFKKASHKKMTPQIPEITHIIK